MSAMTYLLLWNSRSEMAEVIGLNPTPEAATARAEGIESTRGDLRRPLEWVHVTSEEDPEEQEKWVAECGVCDQYEVYALRADAT